MGAERFAGYEGMALMLALLAEEEHAHIRLVTGLLQFILVVLIIHSTHKNSFVDKSLFIK